ncbi:DNA-binding protein [Marinifilum breve]|uniref:DNA-binding protein n=1 Tax=Marinifilum breve TaxID=2184082 RepID=A0A2V3ZRR4_9BACT|nr:DNA-binding protein [Marinifilum breve]PXX95730.1 DNA-binding protein [Marinifilum breve]
MSINFKPVGRKNPRDRQAPAKYYASINAKGKRNIRFIAEEIADRSSLNQMDIMSVIEGFLQIVPKTLLDGYTVDLGEFGNMGLIAKSEGVEKEDDLNASHIDGVKVKFRPGILFKDELASAKFEKIATIHENEVVSE